MKKRNGRKFDVKKVIVPLFLMGLVYFTVVGLHTRYKQKQQTELKELAVKNSVDLLFEVGEHYEGPFYYSFRHKVWTSKSVKLLDVVKVEKIDSIYVTLTRPLAYDNWAKTEKKIFNEWIRFEVIKKKKIKTEFLK